MVYFGSIYLMALYYSMALFYFNFIISQNVSFTNLHSNCLCCKDRLNLVQSQYREGLHKYTTGIFRTANYKIHKAVYMPCSSGASALMDVYVARHTGIRTHYHQSLIPSGNRVNETALDVFLGF